MIKVQETDFLKPSWVQPHDFFRSCYFKLRALSSSSLPLQACVCTFAARAATTARSGDEAVDAPTSKSIDGTTRLAVGDTTLLSSTDEQVHLSVRLPRSAPSNDFACVFHCIALLTPTRLSWSSGLLCRNTAQFEMLLFVWRNSCVLPYCSGRVISRRSFDTYGRRLAGKLLKSYLNRLRGK